MATLAQKRALEEALAEKERLEAEKAREREIQHHKDAVGRFWAYLIVIIMLAASTAANVASAWEYGEVGWLIGGFPALGLFLISTLLERITLNVGLALMLGIGAFLAASYSWFHIANLVLKSGQPDWIAWTFPATVDIPMVMASIYLMQLKAREIGQLAEKAVKAAETVEAAIQPVPVEVVLTKVSADEIQRRLDETRETDKPAETDKPVEVNQVDQTVPETPKPKRAPRKRAAVPKAAVA